MSKKRILIIFMLISIIVIIIFSIYKITDVIGKIELVEESAIKKAESEYPGNVFYVIGITPTIAQHGLNFGVRLGVVDNEITKINCYVTTRTIVNGYYPTSICGGTNIEYLTQGYGEVVLSH